MMNIDQIITQDYYDMVLTHPMSGEPLVTADGREMFIRLSGTDDPEVKKFQAKTRNDVLANRIKMTAEREEKNVYQVMAIRTKDWLIEGESGMIPFNRKTALKLYQDTKKEWLFMQVLQAMGGQQNFLAEDDAMGKPSSP
jgi:hypothetical protein